MSRPDGVTIIASCKKGFPATQAAENLANKGYVVGDVYPFYGLINIKKSDDLQGVMKVEGIELAIHADYRR